MAARKMKEYVSSCYYDLHTMSIFDFIWKLNSNTDWKKNVYFPQELCFLASPKGKYLFKLYKCTHIHIYTNMH